MEILPPGAVQRLEQYISMIEGKEGIGGAYICDTDQWPMAGKSSPGPWFPCQLTHGTIVSPLLGRPFLGMEHIAARGFHVYESTSSAYKSDMSQVLNTLSENELRMLSGNAMSLPAWGAWVFYVFTNTIRLDEAMAPTPERGVSIGFSGSEEEDTQRG